MSTKIEWTDETWNPVTGCDPVSPGCANCYAKRMARRLAGRHGYPEYPNHFNVTLRPARLDEPLKWRKPRRVFAGSMCDLFHDDVPDYFLFHVWEIMTQAHKHTFQVLTKRAERMSDFVNKVIEIDNAPPLPNIWLGVTVENQEQADKRITILLQIPWAVRFVSVEPMLGPVRLDRIDLNEDAPYYNALTGHDSLGFITRGPKLDWVICGAETGPGKRPMELDWARSLRDQCKAAGTPFFFKKDGEGNHTLDGVVYEEFPE